MKPDPLAIGRIFAAGPLVMVLLACIAAADAFADAPAVAKDASVMTPYSPLIELRQYRTYPGKRDVLIELFEREFVESQEAVGMQVMGTFREADEPNHFVWLRGFRDMEERGKGLNAFYFGPVWQRFRDEANPTLEDNDNVLLLREASAGSGFAPAPAGSRAPRGATGPHPGVVIATIYYLNEKSEQGFAAFFRGQVAPHLNKAGMKVSASYVPERSPNNFPRLPVRENENVFVWFSSYASFDEYDAAQRRLELLDGWAHGSALAAKLAKPPEILKLLPTPRSLIPN
jgi:hypothetical protein